MLERILSQMQKNGASDNGKRAIPEGTAPLIFRDAPQRPWKYLDGRGS